MTTFKRWGALALTTVVLVSVSRTARAQIVSQGADGLFRNQSGSVFYSEYCRAQGRAQSCAPSRAARKTRDSRRRAQTGNAAQRQQSAHRRRRFARTGGARDCADLAGSGPAKHAVFGVARPPARPVERPGTRQRARVVSRGHRAGSGRRGSENARDSSPLPTARKASPTR